MIRPAQVERRASLVQAAQAALQALVAQAKRATPTLSFLTIMVIEATSAQEARMAHSHLLGTPTRETTGATPYGPA